MVGRTVGSCELRGLLFHSNKTPPSLRTHRSTITSTAGKYSTVDCNMDFMEQAAP